MQNYQKLLLLTLFFADATLQAMTEVKQEADRARSSSAVATQNAVDYALFHAIFTKAEVKAAPKKQLLARPEPSSSGSKQAIANKTVTAPSSPYIFEFNDQEVFIRDKRSNKIKKQWKNFNQTTNLNIVPSVDEKYFAVLDKKNILFFDLHDIDKLQTAQASRAEFSTDEFREIFALPNGTFATWSTLGIQTWKPATGKNITRFGAPYLTAVILGPLGCLVAQKRDGTIHRHHTFQREGRAQPDAELPLLIPALSTTTMNYFPELQTLQLSHANKLVTTYKLQPDAVEALAEISADSLAKLKKLSAKLIEKQHKLLSAGSKTTIEISKEDAEFFATLPEAVQACLKSNFNLKI